MIPFCKKNTNMSGVVKQETLYHTGSAPALEGSVFTLDKPISDYDFIRFDCMLLQQGIYQKQ